MRWGLVPSWAKDIAIGAKMINARSETIAEKPAFREAFAKRREAYREEARTAEGSAADLGNLITRADGSLRHLESICRRARKDLAELGRLLPG